MRVLVFQNSLSLGGTEKAATEWAQLLSHRSEIDSVRVVALADGPRRCVLEKAGIPVSIWHPVEGAGIMPEFFSCADVIHAHAPGFPHSGDVLGKALQLLGRKIPVVQTNIFGRLENPPEDEWTAFRLFISWTSCVQAARRSRAKLDKDFFRKRSVAVYPVSDPLEDPDLVGVRDEAEYIRISAGVTNQNVVFGRFSRPEPNKWSPMVLRAFFNAHSRNPGLRLLLREPPAVVAADLLKRGLASSFGKRASSNDSPVMLFPATSDKRKLAASQLACDAILHTSSIGESFGYGIAEPMAFGKPVITNSVPWHDQAQLELVRHGECGLIANCYRTMSKSILRLAKDDELRAGFGERSRSHILQLANPTASVAKLETALFCAVEQRDNPNAEEDLINAKKAGANLDRNQWGNSLDESFYLRSRSVKIGFLRWQRKLRDRLIKHRSVLT